MSKAFLITLKIEVFENETEEQAIDWIKDNLNEVDFEITAEENK